MTNIDGTVEDKSEVTDLERLAHEQEATQEGKEGMTMFSMFGSLISILLCIFLCCCCCL
jgi:flagellar biogenesis protein FliO